MTPLRPHSTVPSPTLVLIRPRPRAANDPGARAATRKREIVQGCREVFLVVMATLALGLVSAAIDAGRMGPEQDGANGGAMFFEPHREASPSTHER